MRFRLGSRYRVFFVTGAAILAALFLVMAIPSGYHYLTTELTRRIAPPADSEDPALDTPNPDPDPQLYALIRVVQGIPPGAIGSLMAAGVWNNGEFFIVDEYATEGFVKVFAEDGSFLRQFAALGQDNLQQPLSVKMGADGYIYVLDIEPSMHIYRQDGQLMRRFPIPVRQAGLEGLWVKSFAVAADGTIYVLALDHILKLDPRGQLQAKWSGEGQELWLGMQPSEFYLGPNDIAVSPQGYIYVTDTVNYRLLVLNSRGEAIEAIEVPELSGRLPRLGSLVVERDEEILFVDHNRPAILVYDGSEIRLLANLRKGATDEGWEEFYFLFQSQSEIVAVVDKVQGTLLYHTPRQVGLGRWAGPSASPLFTMPSGVAVSPHGAMAIITGLTGHFFEQFSLVVQHEHNTMSGQRYLVNLTGPEQVLFDDDGYILVLDDAQVKRYDSRGKLLSVFGEVGSEDGQFRVTEALGQRLGPQGLAIDEHGLVWVADTFGQRLQVFTIAGEFVKDFSLNDGTYPTAIAFAERYVWVLDGYSGRLHKYDISGRYVLTVGQPGIEPGQFGVIADLGLFDGPRGLATTLQGEVIVADTYNHRLLVFSSNGALREVIGRGGAASGELFFPSGVWVDHHGQIYVADTYNHRIQVFSRTSP